MTNGTKKTLYLAAPLFSLAERDFNEKLRNGFEEMGFSVFIPQEDSNDTEIAREDMNTSTIYKLNVQAIDNCDLMVAVLDGGSDVDSGTAWEIGYACAKNIPIIGLRTDFRTLGPEGVVNLMIGESVNELVTDVDALTQIMERYLSTTHD